MAKRANDSHIDPIDEAVRNWMAKGWGSEPHLAAALSLYRAEDVVRAAALRLLNPLGLTRSRHELLMLLYFSHGELPLGKISTRLMIHATSVTNTVDALESRGLVERVPHPTDRRTTMARITERGRKLAERSAKLLAADNFGVDALTEAEAETLVELLHKIRIAGGDFLDRKGPAKVS